MLPADLNLTLFRGDDGRVTFILKDQAGNPVVFADDEVTVSLNWGRRRADLVDGAGLEVEGAAGRIVWLVTKELSNSLPSGRLTRFELIRTNLVDGHRTYAVGQITGSDGAAPGDQAFGLTVNGDLEVTVEVIAPGGDSAARTTFDDTLTQLGVTNVQDAIVALFALIGASPQPPEGFAFVTFGGESVLSGGEPVIAETIQ